MAVETHSERIEPRTHIHYSTQTLGYLLAAIVPTVSIGVEVLKDFQHPWEAVPNTHFWHDGAGLSEYGVLAGAVVALVNLVFHNYHGGWTYKTKSKVKHWKETQDKSKVIESTPGWVPNRKQ